MWEFVLSLRNWFIDISDVLDSAVFDIGGIRASLFDLILGFLALGIIISVFWKGARA